MSRTELSHEKIKNLYDKEEIQNPIEPEIPNEPNIPIVPDIEDDNKRIMSQYCDNRGTTYEVVKSFDDIELNGVPKILGVIENNKLMQEIKNELQEKYKDILTICLSSPIYLEINNINASKGNALNFLKKYWNLSDEEVLASGDQDNDIDLLENAGIKVCVGQNSEKLYKIAQHHCRDVNSNELVELVERFIL